MNCTNDVAAQGVPGALQLDQRHEAELLEQHPRIKRQKYDQNK